MRTSAANLATKLIAVLSAAMYAWIAVATGSGSCTGATDSGAVVCMHARLCHVTGSDSLDSATAVKPCCRKAASKHRGSEPTIDNAPESCHCCAKAPGSSVVGKAIESPLDRHATWEPVTDSPFLMLVDGDLSTLNRLVHGRPPPDPCGVASLRARRDCTGLLSSRLVI